jgi:DNA repair protein RecO (recombination protein O)
VASPTYRTRVLVLKKTNLGEADLILTLLREDGSQLRAVAKGARKPKSTFAARMDLFSVCDVLAVSRPKLDIISEARLVAAHMTLREDIARMSAAAPVLESLARASQEDLPVPRLFDMADAALDRLGACELPIAPAITAAFLVKLVSLLGFRPSFSECVGCGAHVDPTGGAEVDFSFPDGGAVCPDCASSIDHVRVPARAITVSDMFLHSTFSQVEAGEPSLSDSFGVLHFCQSWFRSQLNLNLKSLNYLFTCGLF